MDPSVLSWIEKINNIAMLILASIVLVCLFQRKEVLHGALGPISAPRGVHCCIETVMI